MQWAVLLRLLLLSVCASFSSSAAVCDETRPPTGLGDRLTVFWGACALARVRNDTLRSLWRPHARDDPHPAVDVSALVLPSSCYLTTSFYGPVLRSLCRVYARRCAGVSPGCDTYLSLLDTQHGWLLAAWPSAVASRFDVPVSLDTLAATYRAVARETRLGVPYDTDAAALQRLRNATCVHLRSTDKMAEGQAANAVETSEAEWQELREWSLAYLRVAQSPAVFVIGDDARRAALYVRDARRLGLVLLDLPVPSFAATDAGARVLLDLQRLAACAEIVLVAKFSSFALSASLMGGGRLVLGRLAGEAPQAQRWMELGTIRVH